MNAQVLINPHAATEIGQAEFFAANEAERVRRVQEARREREAPRRDLEDAIREFVKSREPSCAADFDEAELRVGDVVWLASCLRGVVAQLEPTFTKLEGERLAAAEPKFLGILADAFTDRLSPELASVFSAAIKAGVQ